MTEQLSPHFARREFACRCGCGAADVSPELVTVLELVREHFAAPVVVVSGRRCATHNSKVGGARNSQHLAGTAADIKVNGMVPADVATWLEANYPQRYGIGRYATFTHIDVRPSPARWRG
ncbi:serine/threonine protein kinase [Klebsiella michiganensis]|uniref:D-Ala-D-Ala carboxypeptidase family metallohydrolase n=1 Tax=Klebsiella michiganensis TaxID=1134687 RepID=UPI0013D22E57|nr:D-Ala-D-Ala carboxypeptidase family metallohydrolase [Klebsiella michiganensis]EIY5008381.1 serine/threonine protein kinase [Klebsiella variicola]MBG2583625.1 serine/threonine protein kinase [Klebsiella michiganensis]MBG2593647.1 serine/threonine protein kinase [Klebsiella michiganensis]MDQ7855521.1 D-Ala-D-Ala carboxypeptidase family metallohydrolase [Klebsiella michiganensis]HAT3609907.1 serine/threonine protein kinase [Klebsiella michiganensis]